MKTENKTLTLALGLACVLLWANNATAQDMPFECDDNFGECGTPEQSGGGGGGGGGSILINNTDLGDTYQFADDYDNDGHEDPYDNCPFQVNADQADDDGDGLGNVCDNCPNVANEVQTDVDGDTIGDVCDDDIDGDGILNGADICPVNPDPLQNNKDNDEWGDACDDDMDNDGVSNFDDNCPLISNPDQADSDPGQWGNECDNDDDGDNIRNTYDNCPQVANADQLNTDNDEFGDVCDSDKDNDDVNNTVDNCILVQNPDQEDLDKDGVGDICDDEFCYVINDDVENCLDPTNPFKIYSPEAETETSAEPITLLLFANQENQAFTYTWTIVSAPAGSSASIENPVGAAGNSKNYLYLYQKDKSVKFSPDKSGTYEIAVTATLEFADQVTGQRGVTSTHTTFIDVTGPDDDMNCSIANVGQNQNALGSILLLGLSIIGLALIRKRKQ